VVTGEGGGGSALACHTKEGEGRRGGPRVAAGGLGRSVTAVGRGRRHATRTEELGG
jgi:hypothetical protein